MNMVDKNRILNLWKSYFYSFSRPFFKNCIILKSYITIFCIKILGFFSSKAYSYFDAYQTDVPLSTTGNFLIVYLIIKSCFFSLKGLLIIIYSFFIKKFRSSWTSNEIHPQFWQLQQSHWWQYHSLHHFSAWTIGRSLYFWQRLQYFK